MTTIEKILLVLLAVGIIIAIVPQTRAIFQGNKVVADVSISRGLVAAPMFNDAQSTIKSSQSSLSIVKALFSIPFTGEQEFLRMYVDGSQCAETKFSIDRGASTQQNIYCTGLAKGTHNVRVDLVTPDKISDSISKTVVIN
jgi:hypothetical protein